MWYHSFRLLFAVLFINHLFVFNYAQTVPDIGSQQPVLVQGKPIERELKGGEVHAYSISLKAGQFFNVTVDQRGIDVVVLLFAPDGKQVAEVDSPNGTQGPEPLFWLAETSGGYSLKVQSLEKDAAGRYEVKVEALRDATPQDKNRIAANKAFAEGMQLLGQKTESSAQKAIEKFQETIPLLRAIGDRYQEARTLDRIGDTYGETGEWQKALDYYNQSLPIWRAIGERGYEATTLLNIGGIYDGLGELQKSLNYYNQALPLAKASGNPAIEANVLQHMSFIYGQMDDTAKMLEYSQKTLSLYRSAGERRGEGHALTGIGTYYLAAGEYEKALEYLNQSAAILRELGDDNDEYWTTMLGIGAAYSFLGNKQKALDQFRLALQFYRQTGDDYGEAYSLYLIAVVERNSNNLGEARKQIEAALAIVESLRTQMNSQTLQSSFFAEVQMFYELYIYVLMRSHRQQPSASYDAAALRVSEQARARLLLDTLMAARADIRQNVPASLLEQEQIVQQKLNAKAQQQSQLLISKQTGQAAALDKEIDALTAEYQDVQSQIRKASPRYAALTQPEPLKLSEIQQEVLDNETILLEYALGEKQSYLWAVTKDSMKSFELPPQAEIEKAVRRVYALVSDGKRVIDDKAQTEYEREAARLSQMLLAPVAAQLQNKRILIVADGALQYLPFGALPSPKWKNGNQQPLIVENEIVSLPSASTLALLRHQLKGRALAPKMIALLADPVFSTTDERIKTVSTQKRDGNETKPPQTSSQSGMMLRTAASETGVLREGLIQRLPFSRREVESIFAISPVGEKKKALDFEANRATALSPEMSQYRIIHFATHGLLNSEHPELSGIVLSLVNEQGQAVDGFLRLNEIYNLNLPAELVVLSACQTALGKEIKGEGLIGLTRGFMYAGSPRVVASLWKVDDVATAELMKLFYKKMLQEKMRPAAALRAAKVEMWKQKRWSAPFYWAAFEIQGEWR